jgi:hypothetical protein
MGLLYLSHKGERDRETEMANRDEDGMTRVDLNWTIEGSKGTRQGTLYGLHEQEVAAARQQIKAQARRGDTVTVREI